MGSNQISNGLTNSEGVEALKQHKAVVFKDDANLQKFVAYINEFEKGLRYFTTKSKDENGVFTYTIKKI